MGLELTLQIGAICMRHKAATIAPCMLLQTHSKVSIALGPGQARKCILGVCMKAVGSLLVVSLLLALPAVAQELGAMTLVEGPLRLIRGTTVLQGTDGVRLRQGDIIESSDGGFAQLEFTDGTIMALGSSTRVLLLSHTSGRDDHGNAKALLLLSGWLKSQTGSTSQAYRYDSPLLAATIQDGSLVLHATAELTEIFVESGSARIGEVSTEGKWRNPQIAKGGQFYSRLAGKNIAVSPRPSSTFIETMPRPFRDTFPSRMPRFANKQPQPKRDHEVTYSEIQPWLTARQAWRSGFVRRFQPRLQDPAFRKALEAHLRDHPEWAPVVNTERN
jgi:hypothetical protein